MMFRLKHDSTLHGERYVCFLTFSSKARTGNSTSRYEISQMVCCFIKYWLPLASVFQIQLFCYLLVVN